MNPILLSLMALVLSGLAYAILRKNLKVETETPFHFHDSLDEQLICLILLAIGFSIRLMAASAYKGFETDINCFLGWGKLAYENGFSQFYGGDSFTDYPPGYIYVLTALEGIRRFVFHGTYSNAVTLLFKLPAILCDLIAAYFIYFLGKKHHHPLSGLFGMAIYLINPTVFFDSAVWGQIDSIYTLLLVLACYFISEKRFFATYLLFTIGVLTKPQMLMAGPIVVIALWRNVYLPVRGDKNALKKVLMKHIVLWLSCLCIFLLLIAPFGIQKTIDQYLSTLSSYPMASVNACNIWSLFGQNMLSQDTTFLGISFAQYGTCFILLTVCLSFYSLYKMQDCKHSYFGVCAFIYISIFVFSVRMHERYIYPALIFLLISYVISQNINYLLAYLAFSTLSYWNLIYALYYYDPYNFSPTASITLFISFLMCMAYYWYFKNIVLGEIYHLKPFTTQKQAKSY